MVVMAEARGTPSYLSPGMQSPRYGGCVSAFFNLFDLSSAKRFSTKRLPANKSEKGSFRRSRSFRTDHGKTRMRHDENAAATTRPSGVVARLMGLESLPEAPYPHHRRSQSYYASRSRPDHLLSPVLLQDLLKRDFKPSKTTKSLRERLFSKRAGHRQYATRKGFFTAFRCRSEDWCISPAFIDIPQAQSRFMYAVTQKQRPFLSRLPPSSTDIHGEAIPELSLLQARSAGRDILLQGWPLASQHNVPRDLYHESDSDLQQGSVESVGSKPTDSASSKPLLTSSKVVHGRRRGSSWHGSDDSESTIDGPHRRAPSSEHHRSLQSRSPAARHPNRRSKPSHEPEPEFKATRRGSSKSPASKAPSERQPLIIPAENSRTSVSHASTCSSQSSVTGELRSVSSKAPSAAQGRSSRAERSGAKSANSPMKNASSPVEIDRVGKTMTTTKKMKSKDTIRSPAMAPGKPPPDRAVKANGKGSPSLDAQSDVSGDGIYHLPKSSLLSHSKLLNGRKEGDSKHSSPKLQRFTEKAAAGGVVSRHKGIQKVRQIESLEVQGVGDRLKTGNTNAVDMASQQSSQFDEPVLSSSKPMRQSQARSVDALFPELPLDCESKETVERVHRLHRPVERVLFSPEFFFTECSNGASMQISMSPLINYDELRGLGEYGKGISSSPLIGCDELRGLGEYGKGISSSPLIDCDELRGLGGGDCITTAENESSSVESYPVDEVRWEDEIVETILSGRCCERSCSGPSISSRSVTFSDEERNGDSWSSCASYNPGDCDSPSDALSDSPRTNFQVKELEVEAEVLHQEPQSPPPQFVQKTLEESLVDEAAGQPSPVSVLQSPFHDETCTTAESSPEPMQQMRSEESRDAPTSNSDRIKQALLDISTFRIHDDSTCEPQAPREHPKDEQRFTREVLSAANFLCTPGSSPAWHSPDCAIDPSLFDRLESEGVALASGGLWRCDRKLLFDCVNEAFGLSSRLWHFQWAPEPVFRLARPRGQELVVTVVKTIEEWRQLAAFAIDALIERDMSVHYGHWRFVAPEVVEVGVEIESMVWNGILDEVVVDIVESRTQKYGTALFCAINAGEAFSGVQVEISSQTEDILTV